MQTETQIKAAESTARGSKAGKFLALLLPLLLYLCISLYYFGTRQSWTKQYFGISGDPVIIAWFLHWWPFAMHHGLNPFQSHYAWYPNGANLTWSTSVPFLALLTAPITFLGGPVLSFNLLTLSAPALAGWAAFLLARDITGKWLPSVIAGYLFGFSSYELGQLQGHLNLDVICLVPLAVLLCVRRFRGTLGRTWFIALLALLLLAQLGISTEILATLCVLGAISWCICLCCAPADDKRRLWGLALDIVYTAIPVVVLASPFLWYLIKGLPELPHELAPTGYFSAEPLNYIIPNVVSRFGPKNFAALIAHFNGGGCEQEAYLGVPLVLIALLYFHSHWARPYVRALLIAICVIVVLSLGPSLHVAGFDIRQKLPWYLIQRLPLMHHVLPTRFTMYVALCASLTGALWLADAATLAQRRWRYALAVLAMVALMPDTGRFGWTAWPSDAFFMSPHVQETLGHNPNVFILPLSLNGPQMAAQLDSGMGFTQSAGAVGLIPNSELEWDIVNPLIYGTEDGRFGNDFTAFCDTHHVQYVLVGPGTTKYIVDGIAALHWPHHLDGDMDVVRVPDSSTLDYNYIKGDYWPSVAAENWMGKQIRITTHGAAMALTLNGKDRPVAEKVHVTLTGGINASYDIGKSDRQTVTLPANTTTTVTADQLFTPDEIAHNGDGRQMSVMVSLAAQKR